MFRTLDISTSGMAAQRLRMDTIAGNIAHANTIMDEEGRPAPFQRRIVTFQVEAGSHDSESRGQGVRTEIEIDAGTPFRRVYDPGHPHRDAEGFVSYPNVDLVTEFVNAMEASRAYEANVAAIDLTKEMLQRTVRILA